MFSASVSLEARALNPVGRVIKLISACWSEKKAWGLLDDFCADELNSN
jgi:hypothetical protein